MQRDTTDRSHEQDRDYFVPECHELKGKGQNLDLP